MSTLALLEAVHGHAGILATAALVHPAIQLRRGAAPGRGAHWATALSALVVAAAFASGLVVYPGYIALVRARLFAVSERAGLLFETKEHLALMVVASALGAAGCVGFARPEDRDLRRGAAGLFALSALLCFATVAIGTYLAALQTFPR